MMVPVRGRQVRVWCSTRKKEAEGSKSIFADGLLSSLVVLAPSKGKKSRE